MGDRVAASIKIGGQVKDLDALCEAIEAECLGVDYGGGEFEDREDLESYLRDATDKSGAWLASDQVNYGDLSDLEAVCREQGLSYETHWESGCEFPAGGRVWTPEDGVHEYTGDAGSVNICASEIRGMEFADLDALLAYLDKLDKFEPGPLVVPPPLVQAVIKARKEHADA